MEARYADQGRNYSVIGGTILVGLCLSFAALLGRLVHINTALAPKLSALVQNQQIGRTALPARRGSILDAAGRLVAGTRTRPSVFADPVLIDDLDETALRLSMVLAVARERIAEILYENEARRFCWISRLIEPQDAVAVRELKLRGIGVRNESQRYYPMGELLAPTLGIVGREGRGLEGIELAYDEHLRGVDGQRVLVYDGRSRRRPIRARTPLSHPERDGGHIMLTIDGVIQSSVEKNLRAAVESFNAESGVAVVMSPKTGDVLALAQYPSFDANDYGAADVETRRNRVICDAAEPGSTFKSYVACGALIAGVVDPDEEIDCGNGERRFGRRVMHDSSPHGLMTFEGIIAKSSNIGMGVYAERMGNDAIHSIVRAFGFGARLGIRFPGEATGIVLPLSRWTSYSTTSVPIGQEVSATPLQLATAFCAIVNGGELMRPRLVKAILNAESEIVKYYGAPDVVRRVMPRETARYMTEQVLVGVVKNGGGRAAALADWQMLGKTGTAQMPFLDRKGYEPSAYIGSFIGAAPAGDPACVALVMIHRPDTGLGYFGTTVAAPAVRSIMADTLAYFNIPPSSRLASR